MYARDVLEVLDREGVDKFSIIGISRVGRRVARHYHPPGWLADLIDTRSWKPTLREATTLRCGICEKED